MEIILLEDIGGLGKRGSAVRVADGYARNFLIPRKKAIEAVGNARAVFKDRERARVALEAKQRQAAEGLRDELAKLSLQFSVEAGEEDQLYGSGAHEIRTPGCERVPVRQERALAEPSSARRIRSPIHLFGDLTPVKVWVVRKGEGSRIP
jgi:hypothetical protein